MAGHNFIGISGTNNFEPTEDKRRKTEDRRWKRQGFHIKALTWMDSVSIVNHRLTQINVDLLALTPDCGCAGVHLGASGRGQDCGFDFFELMGE